MKFTVAVIIPVAVILFALLILLSKLRVILIYIRKGEDDRFSIRLAFLGGLFALKFDISTAEVIQRGLRSIQLNKRQGKQGKKAGIKELYRFCKNVKKDIEEYNNLTGIIKDYLLSKNRIIIEKISLDITIGLKDASMTGIVSGIIHAFIGIMDSFILNNFKISNRDYFVRSDYAGESINFKINLLCIISTRIVHIIMVGFILAINGLKKIFLIGGG